MQKITAALHEVMSKVGYVQKKGRNDFHRYNYAGEKDLLEALRPAMVEAGLLLLPSVTQAIGPDEFGNTHVRVEYTLAHKDGEVWPEKIVAMGCGNDKNSKGGIGDKGTYKAITGANKYLLFKLFQIETGDDPETDERDVEPPQRNQAAANRQPTKSETPKDTKPAEPIILFMAEGEVQEFPRTVKGAEAYFVALDELVRRDRFFWKQNGPTAEELAAKLAEKVPGIAGLLAEIKRMVGAERKVA